MRTYEEIKGGLKKLGIDYSEQRENQRLVLMAFVPNGTTLGYAVGNGVLPGPSGSFEPRLLRSARRGILLAIEAYYKTALTDLLA